MYSRSLTATMLAIVLLLPAAATSAQDDKLVQHLEQIANLIRDNKLREAETQLASFLRSRPNAPVALNLLGTIRAKQSRMKDAESLFLRAISGDPRFTGARMNLAYLYLLEREPAKAVVQLEEVLNVAPDHADATERLAELLLSQRRYDECIDFLEQQRASRSLPASLLVVLGDAHLAKGSLAEAEEQYLQALEGRLENAGALLGLAQLSRLKGETKETTLYLTRVATLSAESKSPEFLYKFALVALQSGMADAARVALENSLQLRPDEPAYLLALGIAWLRQGDLFESEQIFRRLLQLQPASAQGQIHLGYILLNQKKYQEARVWLEKSARSTNPMPEVFYYLGLVAQEQNDDANAIQLFEKAVQKLPSYAHARIALGSSYMKLRNYARAKEELETAVKLDPEEPKAHYNLALLYARLKDPARAQEAMRAVERLKAKGASTDGVVVLPPNSSPH